MKTKVSTRVVSAFLAVIMVLMVIPILPIPVEAETTTQNTGFSYSYSSYESYRINVSKSISIINVTNKLSDQKSGLGKVFDTLGKVTSAAGSVGAIVGVGLSLIDAISKWDNEKPWYENVGNIALTAICSFIGVPFGEENPNEEVLNAISDLKDNMNERFDYVDESIQTLSNQQKAQFAEISNLITDTATKQKYENAINQFSAAAGDKFGEYLNYYVWRDSLYENYAELINQLEDSEAVEKDTQNVYDALYACAREADNVLKPFMKAGTVSDNEFIAIQEIYNLYLLLLVQNGTMSGEEAIAQSIALVTELYGTYAMAQYCLALCYNYQYAKILKTNGKVSSSSKYYFEGGVEYKDGGSNKKYVSYNSEISPWFDGGWEKNMDEMRQIVAKSLSKILILDNELGYSVVLPNGNTQFLKGHYTTDGVSFNNQVSSGDTLYFTPMPQLFVEMFDYDKFTYSVSDESLATVNSDGVLTVNNNGQLGKFTLSYKYDGVELFSKDFFVVEKAPFSGGIGTEEFPYLIHTKEDFNRISEHNTKCFLLTNDMSLDGMGSLGDFHGMLDGNGHTLTGWSTSSWPRGLFFNNYGTIKNVNLRDFQVDANLPNQGGLMEIAFLCVSNSGTIENVNVSSSRVYARLCNFDGHPASGGENTIYVGAICTINYGTIKKSAVIECELIGDSQTSPFAPSSNVYVGFIAGRSLGGTISDVVSRNNKATVTALTDSFTFLWEHDHSLPNGYVGGVVGYCKDTVVERALGYKNALNTNVSRTCGHGDGIENYGGSLVGKCVSSQIIDCYSEISDTLFGYVDENSNNMAAKIETDTMSLDQLPASFGDNDWVQSEAQDHPSFKVGCFHRIVESLARNNATCVMEGSTFGIRCLDCKEVFLGVEKIVPLGHEFGDWTVINETNHARKCNGCNEAETTAHVWDPSEETVEATHTSDGKKTFTCVSCKTTRTEITPKLTEHSFVREVVDVKYIKSEATCTEGAVYFKSCECGEKGTETFTVGVAKGHGFGQWIKKDDSKHVRMCTCGEVEVVAHKWEVASQDQGASVYVCKDCKAQRNIPVNAAVLSISESKGVAGDLVDVKVLIKNSPGITSMAFDIAFDEEMLSLENVVYNKEMGGQTIQPKTKNSPARLYWIDSFNDYKGDCVFATLTFKVKDGVSADQLLDLTVTYNPEDIFNLTETNVEFVIENGCITVVDYVPGDINGDEVVNNKDVTRLMQYHANWDVEVSENALDVNGDGSHNNKDVTRLMQYVADENSVQLH